MLAWPELTAAAGASSFFVNALRRDGAYNLATLSRLVRERLPR